LAEVEEQWLTAQEQLEQATHAFQQQ